MKCEQELSVMSVAKVRRSGNCVGVVQRRAACQHLFLQVVMWLLLALCSTSAYALYETNSPPGGLANAGLSPYPGTTDHLVWEFLVKKYSASGTSLTAADLGRMAKSLQKCGGVQDGIAGASSPQLQSGRKFDAGAGQVSNCKRVLTSITELSNGRSSSVFNQTSFEQICPQLLYYTANADCCAGDAEESLPVPSVSVSSSRGGSMGVGEALENTPPLDSRAVLKKEKPSSGEVWGYGFLLVTIISCSSLVGVSLMPFMAKDFYKHLLTVMIGLAVGSLTGSAIFHLLPQALRLSEADPDHGYLPISLVIVGGIWLFFMVERILKFIMDYKERKGKNWKREKMSSVLAGTPESSTIAVMTENGNLMKGPLVGEANGEQRNSLIFPSTPRDTGVIYECQEQAIKASFGHQEKPRLSSCHDHHVTFEQGKDSVIATVAWMIIFGDGLHNFIDGLSIGAAFNESIWTGVSISVAVLCEELPHELGDFAVLLNAGMSMRQAVTYNFLSACTCYIGMAVGILLGEIEASSYIFALAGGMFLYISLVDMVPEMNEIAQETSKISVKKGFLTLLLQNIGLFSGISALYLLALYQDSFQF